MQVYIAQLDTVWHDRPANHAKAEKLLRSESILPNSLIVLPEAFPVGFSMEIGAIADREGQTTKFLSDLARDHAATVIGGNITSPDSSGRNQAVIADANGSVVETYDKIHPFSFADETLHYTRGQRVVTHAIGGTTIAPFICYDLRFPEVFRIATLRGAEVLIVIANWPTARVDHWVTLLRARAIENQAFVIGCNRVGTDPNVQYPGRSMVIDPRGRVVADAADTECLLTAELDLPDLRDYRKSFPALNDVHFISG